MASGVKGFEVTGLRETVKYLNDLGVTDDAVKDAMQGAGAVVQREALRLVPVRTGKLARTIKVNRSKSLLRISAGSKAVPYAYTMHAQYLGRSNGGFTFRHPARGGRAAFVRQAYIPNRPFLYLAWERKAADVYRAFVESMTALAKGA